MDLRYSEAEEQFRKELREWLGGVPADAAAQARASTTGPARRAYDTDWQRQLFEAGYAGINWPHGVRRPGRHAHRAADLPRGDHPRRRALRRA